MKKILAFILASLMIVICFAACGSNNNETSQTTAQTAAGEENDWTYIYNKNKLVVGVTYFAPMDYFEKGSEELIGFDADLAKAVAYKLGVDVEFQEINWDSKEAELNSKAIDCIWNGLTVTTERMEQFDFSYNYMENKQALVIRKADAEKFGTTKKVIEAKATVAAEAGSAGEDYIKANLADCKYLDVEAQSNVFTELKAGTVDCGVVDITMAGSMINTEGSDFADLMIVDLENAEPEFYAIGFRRGSDETVKRVNEALMELYNEGKIAEIAAKYGLTDVLVNIPEIYNATDVTTAETGNAGEVTAATTAPETTEAETTAA